MRAVLSSHALLIGLATPAVWPYRSIIVVASAACVREIGRFPRDCRSKPSEGRHDDETSSSVTIGISAQDKMDTAYCPSRRARRDTYDRLEMWPRLPSSLASARGVYVRGGAGDTAPKAPMFKQRAVNRKPVPAAEAVSRYDTTCRILALVHLYPRRKCKRDIPMCLLLRCCSRSFLTSRYGKELFIEIVYAASQQKSSPSCMLYPISSTSHTWQ